MIKNCPPPLSTSSTILHLIKANMAFQTHHYYYVLLLVIIVMKKLYWLYTTKKLRVCFLLLFFPKHTYRSWAQGRREAQNFDDTVIKSLSIKTWFWNQFPWLSVHTQHKSNGCSRCCWIRPIETFITHHAGRLRYHKHSKLFAWVLSLSPIKDRLAVPLGTALSQWQTGLKEKYPTLLILQVG